MDHDGDEKPVDAEVELVPFIGLSVMIMLMRMTTTIMTMIMTIMMMILMIIMMVSIMIMMVMKTEWKRRLSFLHLSAPECQLKVAVVPLIITRIDHHSADYDHDGQHKKQYLQRLSSGLIIILLTVIIMVSM